MPKTANLEHADNVEVVLPFEVVGIDELRNNPAALGNSEVTEFVFGLTGDVLREGVRFSATDDIHSGIRIQLVNHHIELDLSDEAVAALLLQHLQPRFRAILEGVVR